MDVPTLRYSAPVDGIFRQFVSVNHRHRAIEVGQHSGGEQPAHAGARDDCVITQYRHVWSPNLAVCGFANAVHPATGG
jgi:hypothetical protein